MSTDMLPGWGFTNPMPSFTGVKATSSEETTRSTSAAATTSAG